MLYQDDIIIFIDEFKNKTLISKKCLHNTHGQDSMLCSELMWQKLNCFKQHLPILRPKGN